MAISHNASIANVVYSLEEETHADGSITIASGSDIVLIVSAFVIAMSEAAATTSGVTCGGSAMTKVKTVTISYAGIWFIEQTIWTMIAPGTGSKAIIATGHASSMGVMFTASAYSGVNQTTTPDASGSKTGTTAAGNQTFTVTTVANNCWVYAAGFALASTCAALTWTARTTDPTYGIATTEDTNGPKTPAGAVTIGFTIGTTYPAMWLMAGVSFAPSGAAANTYAGRGVGRGIGRGIFR